MKHGINFFGMATVGERGQVVIPSKARKEMNIKTGDRMMVVRGPAGNAAVVFLKVDTMKRFIGGLSKMIGKIKEEIDG